MIGRIFTLLAPLASVCAQERVEPLQTRPTPPRIVVLLMVDQMIPEQLERLGPYFQGGFARLLGEGRLFQNTWLGYSNTETGPGHATIATGVLPDRHGIIANEFYDRVDGRPVNCIDDNEVIGLHTAPGEGARTGRRASPRRLQALTLGDYLQQNSSKAHVVSIAGKDRSAILLGGQSADAALWWDLQVGGFATSTWYGDELPPWVEVWNNGWRTLAAGWRWEELYPAGLKGSGTLADDQPGEGGTSPVFPHLLTELEADPGPQKVAQLASQVFSTPLLDRFVVDLALLALEHYEFGLDDTPDLLALSFSACDVAGHTWGPHSREVTDLLLRLDLELARLLSRLDELVGSAGWLLCLSSDHGVLELPEALQARNLGAVRLSGRVLGELVAAVKQALRERYQSDFQATWTEGIALDAQALRSAAVPAGEVRQLVREVALGFPWVERAYTLTELIEDGQQSSDPWCRLAAHSVTAERGPDVFLQLAPYTLVSFNSGTSHGSPYPYDRHVPLLFRGPGVEPGRSYDPVTTVDVVPTLLHTLGLDPQIALDGNPLVLR